MFIKIILLIIVIGNCSDTVLNKECQCTEIQNETDCLRTQCKYETGQCKIRLIESYCQLPTIIAQCPVRGCALYDNTCQLFSGCTAYLAKTYDQCQKISNLCTSDGERCVTLSQCTTYKSKISCNVDDKDKYCYYDETDKNNPMCRDVQSCLELPITLKTDQECRNSLSKCTINDKNAGCIDSGITCKDQKTKQQCVTNLDQTIECIWNTTTSLCMDYICANGFYKTYEECSNYKIQCTVSEAKTECMDLIDCPNYKSEDTCKVGLTGACLWLNEKCQYYTCDQASDDYTNHQLCVKFLDTCTVDDDGLGCKNKANTCDEYQFKFQCVIDIQDNQCYWNNNKSKCTNYDCDNADVTQYNNDTCNMFLSICQTNPTANGCIVKSCTDALTQTLCTKLKCLWQDNSCLDFTCSNAPTSLTTTTQCEAFKSGCYTNGAGCSSNGLCTDIKTNAACTTDAQNQRCIWLNSACKVKTCSDIIYVSHSECNNELDQCTTDGTKCIAKIQKCEDYLNQLSCVHSLDGPCLWVENKCYLYESCSSLPGTTHEFCNKANKYCTTDGVTCVPISSCAQTQQTGCYVGTDGECVRNLDKTATTICEKFTKCQNMNYTTHYQCNREKSACTVSNDKKNCMDLQSLCTGYTTQDNCQITSTNKTCQWDVDKCRDQKCTDIIKTSYNDCQSTNKQCTTDGSKCIDIQTCSQYTTIEICKYGTDGDCLFDQKLLKCRLKLCSDVTDIKLCTTLNNNCYPDSELNKCIEKSTCIKYSTETSCKIDGTDGICTWDSANKKCSLMTKCEDANSFEVACRKKSNICKWTPKPSNGGSSSCKQFTCTSKNTGSTCSPLDAFSGTEYQVCAELQLTCQAASISDLTEDTCFINSAKTHYWDKTTNKCLACNGTSVTNSTIIEDSFSYIIILYSFIVLLY